MYLCRSPLLAFDFWGKLADLQKEGVTITPKITQEICEGMKAGQDPRCIRVEGEDFKPVSGDGRAMAMIDGKTEVWFHNPDAGRMGPPGLLTCLTSIRGSGNADGIAVIERQPVQDFHSVSMPSVLP